MECARGRGVAVYNFVSESIYSCWVVMGFMWPRIIIGQFVSRILTIFQQEMMVV